MNQWPRWQRSAPATLVQYVLPTEVAALLTVPGRSQASPVDRLRAVYEAMARAGVRYSQPQASDMSGRQRIAEPYEVLHSPKQGTCIDLAVVMAAAARHAGLTTMIVVADAPGPGAVSHALLCVHVDTEEPWPFDAAADPRSAATGVWPDPPPGLRRLIGTDSRSPHPLLVVDPVGVCLPLSSSTPEAGLAVSFDRACEQGRRHLEDGGMRWAFGVDVDALWSATDQQEPYTSARRAGFGREHETALLIGLMQADLADDTGKQGLHQPLVMRVHEPDPHEAPGVPEGPGRPLSALLDEVTRSPLPRLVLTGAAGSGKSTAARELALRLLGVRQTGGPVPVLVNMSTWNPERDHLDTFIGRQLELNYASGSGVRKRRWLSRLRGHPQPTGSLVRELVEQRRLLPLLDGLDELPQQLWPTARRELARTLGAADRAFVLVCTTESAEELIPWELAGREDVRAVRMTPVAPVSSMAFLRGASGGGAARWDGVEQEIAADPDGPLAAALGTPLMIDLARTVYAKGPARPDELCDRQALATEQDVRQRLFERYLPTVYASWTERLDQRTPTLRRKPYPPADAQRWLTFLARQLDRMEATQLFWWQLVATTKVVEPVRPTRLTTRPRPRPLLIGLLLTAAAVLVSALWERPAHARFSTGFLAFEFRTSAREQTTVWRQGGHLWVIVTSSPVLTLSIALGLTGALLSWLIASREPPETVRTTASPAEELALDKKAFLTRVPVVAAVAAVIGVVVSLSTAALGMYPDGDGLTLAEARARAGAPPWWLGVEDTAMAVLCGVLLLFLSSAWSRLWATGLLLSLSRRMPRDPLAFLEDAHARGVLRRNGSAYAFRHRLLQRHLTAPNRRAPALPVLIESARRREEAGAYRQAVALLRPLALYEPAARRELALLAERQSVRVAGGRFLRYYRWKKLCNRAIAWWNTAIAENDEGARQGLAGLYRREAANTFGWKVLGPLKAATAAVREVEFWDGQETAGFPGAEEEVLRLLLGRAQDVRPGLRRQTLRDDARKRLDARGVAWQNPAPSTLPASPYGRPAAAIHLGDTVRRTLDAAARAGGVLHTGRVLALLAEQDAAFGDWDRLWLYTGDPPATGLAAATDTGDGAGSAPPGEVAARAAALGLSWPGDTEMSPAVSESLRVLHRMTQTYPVESVPPGWLALALVRSPDSGASRALTGPSGLTHVALLRHVMDDILLARLPCFLSWTSESHPGTVPGWEPAEPEAVDTR
ncbi:NACHT domain-containing protein [Streptomyces erythrochromogenes]|uniref:NACHT domain-containing protein n=1 Tax=Streptomyces erythrochromogenes TaxID=285574 RepID=UPI00344472EA